MTALRGLAVLGPTELCGVRLRNRIGLAPLNTGLFQEEPFYRHLAREFYTEFASNDIGLVFFGGIAVCPEGRANSSSLALTESRQVNLLGEVIDACHTAGAAVAVQLEHAGRQADPREIGAAIIAASGVPCPVVGALPLEAAEGDIARVVRHFAVAAALAEQAGADLLEIHAAHGYLLSGFLSSYSNHRTDQYGGTLQNRFSLLDRVIKAVRDEVSLPIGVRLNVEEGEIGGLTVDDVVNGVRSMSQRCDYISVSAGVYTRGVDLIMPPKTLGPAVWRKHAGRLRRELKLPVLLAGNLDTIETAESVVGSGEADVVLMGRALLTDPFLVTKINDGRRSDVLGCIYCAQCKYHSRGLPHIYCPLNELLRARRLPVG